MTSGVNRVVVVGAGFVGSSYAYALVNQGITEELVLIDVNQEKAEGEVMDLNHGRYFYESPAKVWSGDYHDCKEADIVCITAGVSQSDEETRLSAVEKNTSIVKSIVDSVMASGFNGIFLISTNPVDIITQATWTFSGLPKERVIGSGTILDTARYLHMLGEYFSVDPKSINGYIIGEHGDSQVAALSNAAIGGKNVMDILNASDRYMLKDLEKMAANVRDIADVVIEKKGSTYYGIGAGLAKITKAILKNENTVLPVSALLDGEYGFQDIFAGVPAIINRQGVQEIIEVDLNKEEKDKLASSIEVLRSAMKPLPKKT
ncbi:L-lactate dehydrogenase 2 [Lentibacillus kapialis]|uniref:L-lactate dehydrogenase n=1 Tax=Lentibacillus kapialis TaxID=340214 RepID=A0A917PRI3_9BACI|nr:L-lactate dehydrogenase [Lentibacillus kapialis]GGJ88464.1 L-lactate dehydrogenase 2 [Lentibacillus kapialis]